MIDILKRLKADDRKDSFVSLADFNGPEFRKQYSVYLLGEVKDQVSFYHTEEEYESFLKFFEYLNGKPKFDYVAFLEAYDSLINFLKATKIEIPDFFETPNRFLQYLFDLNVISYIERMDDDDVHVHWCFRERSYANLNPKVKSHKEYEIHYGLGKMLNIGKEIKKKSAH